MNKQIAAEKYNRCGACERFRPIGSIEIFVHIAIIKDDCNNCRICVEECSTQAI